MFRTPESDILVPVTHPGALEKSLSCLSFGFFVIREMDAPNLQTLVRIRELYRCPAHRKCRRGQETASPVIRLSCGLVMQKTIIELESAVCSVLNARSVFDSVSSKC